MNTAKFRWSALVLAGLLLAACRDKHEPIKPTVQPPAASAPLPAR